MSALYMYTRAGGQADATRARSSSLLYLSAGALHQGLRDGVEVGLAAKQAVEEHEGRARSLPIEHVIGQVDCAVEEKRDECVTRFLMLNEYY